MLRPKKAVWYGAPCDELGLSPIPMDPHVCCRGLQRYGLKNQCGMEHLVMNKVCIPFILTHTSIVEASNTMAL